MAKYAAATIDMWDYDGGATTAWQQAPRPKPAVTATTTPTPAQEVSIWIKSAVQLPKWFEKARDALNALSALPANWNSYAALQIDVEAVTGAVELLLGVMDENKPLPTFVPVSHGGVLLEWHTAAADLEIGILPSGRIHVVFEKADAEPIELEGLPQEIMEPVRGFLQAI